MALLGVAERMSDDYWGEGKYALKTCPKCPGKKFFGLRGLFIHKSKMHKRKK
jgi:hypothetical protein